MPAFTLKRFQQQALAALDAYLRAARLAAEGIVFKQLPHALPR